MTHYVLDTIAKRSSHMKWIKDRTVLLVRHGSHAYGTNTITSDEDFKGIAIPTKEYFFGSIKHFEQAELKAPNPDAVIYDIRKFFSLASDCNPNIIEVLHTDAADHFVVDPIGEMILDHKNDFLSKKVKYTMTGYAVSQLKRIKLHRQYLLNPPKIYPTRAALGLPEQTLIPQDQLMAAQAEIQKELDKFQFDFLDDLSESAKIEIRSIMAEMLSELKITTQDHWMAAARKIGLSDNFIQIMQRERAYISSKREWDQYQNWRKTRNPARAALEEKFGYDCYLDDTEFLTEKGWLRYDEIRDETRLATLNKKNGCLEFQHLTERVSKNYNGPIVFLETQDTACAVTPNHRMWMSEIKGGKSNILGTEYNNDTANWNIIKAQDMLSGKRYSFHARTAVENTGHHPINDYNLIIVGAYVSEGCVNKRLKNGDPSSLRFSQKLNGRLEPFLEKIKEESEGKIRKYPIKHNRSIPIIENIYILSDREIAKNIVLECGEGSLTKKLPNWITSLSQEKARFLLDVLVAGDGTNKKYSRVYYTSSKRLADDVQILAMVAGFTSKIWGPYENDNNAPMYQIYIGQDRFTRVITKGKNSHFTVENVSDKRIVCFTVPNEILITRRGGKIAIQGNTKHAYHLVRLIRMCREILATGKVIVKRPDWQELLTIRNGAWTYDQVIEFAEREEGLLNILYSQSNVLPKSPDREKLDQLCIHLVDKSLSKHSWYNMKKYINRLIN